MLHDLVQHSAVDETLAEISEVLGFDVRTLDSTDALHSPVSVQLAIFAVGVSTARALQRSGVQPLVVAGLSIGAFSAAVAAEAVELSDAVRLVRSRAEQMERMYPTGYGLGVIVGLNEVQVTRLVAAANTREHPVFVGNQYPETDCHCGFDRRNKRSSGEGFARGGEEGGTAGCSGTVPLPALATRRRLAPYSDGSDFHSRSEGDLYCECERSGRAHRQRGCKGFGRQHRSRSAMA
jgi:hypothetical protein